MQTGKKALFLTLTVKKIAVTAIKILITLTAAAFFCSCSQSPQQATVISLEQPPGKRPARHRVVAGDTLFSIAKRYGLDYHHLALRNRIEPPYRILVGSWILLDKTPVTQAQAGTPVAVVRPQVPLHSSPTQVPRVNPPASVATVSSTRVLTSVASSASSARPHNRLETQAGSSASRVDTNKTYHKLTMASSSRQTPVKPPASSAPIRTQPSSMHSSTSSSSQPLQRDMGTGNPNKSLKNQTTAPDIAKKATPKTSSLVWSWPLKGSLIGRFSSAKSINKGVDIAAKFGESVRAAADGEVVYAGSGLRGYGKLLIIKHPATYLSAYAHNSRLLVREGDRVHRGQIIAEAGDTESNVIKLHFEIRRNGIPVDPLVLLPPMYAR